MTALATALPGATSGVLDEAPPMPLPVLMYHSVGDSVSADFRHWEVPPGVFAEQLGALAAGGYHLTGLTDALRHPHRRQVAITFDDGFEDFLTTALPALQTAGASATLYIPTAYPGRRATWLDGYSERNLPLLDWPDLADLAGEGIELGSHGHRHLELDVVPTALARYDVTASRRMIEEKTGRSPDSFSYPFGYHCASVRHVVAAAGFDSACEVGYRLHQPTQSRFGISRLVVDRAAGAADILRLVTRGHRDALTSARRGLRSGWRAYRAARWRLGREG
ncbi:polysaccharide deacetylase family protein [Candidatus Frankia alpina]|uniref:Polysaccharide deacetylase family protein n=1 Tax=Candidatus Frankia alpina TaxID=2699483 RepID=A0A4V3Z7N1_9ACTN|nr:polysaccharide deacetylase family protein [Candidatus Frankia alpina]THJ74589.1 polysaccharide deacetylase family protein [Candidatus Frankia alpina]